MQLTSSIAFISTLLIALTPALAVGKCVGGGRSVGQKCKLPSKEHDIACGDHRVVSYQILPFGSQ